MFFMRSPASFVKLLLPAAGLVFALSGFFAPAPAHALTTTQVQSIIAFLRVFGADTAVIANVESTLLGSTVAQPSTTASGATRSSRCIVILNALALGSSDSRTGGEVTKLQQFLSDSDLYDGPVTGYFGPLTLSAVQKFQAESGTVSSGSPDTTGYGRVGPATRNALAKWCRHLPTSPSGTALSASPSSGTAPLTVRFSYTDALSALTGGSTDVPTANIDFGDGRSGTMNVPFGGPDCGSICTVIVSHTYTSADTYTAQVSDNDNTATATVSVSAVSATPPIDCPQGSHSNGATCVADAAASAIIDSGSLSQNQGPITIVGTTQNLPTNSDGIDVFLVPYAVNSRSDYTTISGQMGRDGFYKGGISSRDNWSSWSAGFSYVNAGSYRVYVFAESISHPLLTAGTLTVTLPAPASLSASPTSGTAPLTVTFSGVTDGGSYTMSYGDNSTGSALVCDSNSGQASCDARNVSFAHTYSAPGTYIATFTNGGKTATATVTVSKTPVSLLPSSYTLGTYSEMEIASATQADTIASDIASAGVKNITIGFLPNLAANTISAIKTAEAHGLSVTLVVLLSNKNYYDPNLNYSSTYPPLSQISVTRFANKWTQFWNQLESEHVPIAGIVVGNEENSASNGDLQVPAPSPSQTYLTLVSMPSAMARAYQNGMKQYVQIVQKVYDLRSLSAVNRTVPIVTFGTVYQATPNNNGGRNVVDAKLTMQILEAYGIDGYVDAHSIHYYPDALGGATDAQQLAQLKNQLAACTVGGTKPCWITEWGAEPDDTQTCPANESTQLAHVQKQLSYFSFLAKWYNLVRIYYFKWEDVYRPDVPSDHSNRWSIWRCGGLTPIGQMVVSNIPH